MAENFLENYFTEKTRKPSNKKYHRFFSYHSDSEDFDLERNNGNDLNQGFDPNAGDAGPSRSNRSSRKRRRSNIEIEINNDNDDSVLRSYQASISSNNSPSNSQNESINEEANEEQPPGSLHLLSQKYESLDYDLCENLLFLEEQKKFGVRKQQFNELLRWVLIFFIGFLTALTACIIVIVVEILSKYKYSTLETWVNDCSRESNTTCLLIPFGIWIVFNAVPAALGSALVTYIAPVAAGSGIPVIKCYLNGVKIPEVVRIKTYFAKLCGVILSVVGGLACGKEGPMIHCGAVIAAGISQGKSTTFGKDTKLFQKFREDREKRDFVSAGAAAGVAAAFGAPVGGVLFSLEEGASFWNQVLTWRIFFCSMVSTFALNLILSTYNQHPGLLNYSGLLNFGKFKDDEFQYNFVELPLYILMGAFGGIMGALFNHLNYKLTVFRIRYLHIKWIKVIEAAVVATMTATVGFIMIFYSKDCHSKNSQNVVEFPIQFNCPEGQYSAMGALWFNTPEATLRNLFHDEKGTWQPASLAIFWVIYFFLACWTYGLSISAGLFIPSLLTGAAWGRLFALLIEYTFPSQQWVCPGKFAFIGAAASLGGVVRMTISLTVILIEASGNITFGLPIMITLMVAKWVGDLFTEGLYDIHIQLASVPFLNWEPPTQSSTIYASEVMSTPVTTFRATEKVGRIIDVLIKQPHNGFPVVDPVYDTSLPADNLDTSFSSSIHNLGQNVRAFGRFRGLILRWQLIVLLKEKIFNELHDENDLDMLTSQTFRNAYPRYPSIESVLPFIQPYEREFTVDLRPVMNPSAYSISYSSSLPRIFRLFRALGLRHLAVVNDRNEVIGIVTRKDIARYRAHYHQGKLLLEEMQISRN